MRWIDGHLDLAYLALGGRDLTRPVEDRTAACLDLPGLRAANVDTVFATIFTEPDGAPGDAGAYARDDVEDGVRAGLEQLAVYEGLEQAGEVMIVRSAGDLDADGSLPRLVLLMEGADPMRDAEHVAWWASRGLWLVGLTWATGTRYAGGNARPGPITAAGRDVVRAIDQAGLVHDASHLATTALDDLLDLATGPIVATHSNCRSITGDDERHLTDDHIRAIGARGGVVGLNLYRRFIAGSGPVTAAHAIEHVVRVAELMNRRDGVALGSDMDGGFGPEGLPDDVRHPSAFGALAAGLRTAGWNDEEIEGFAWRNWTGFLRTVIH